MDHSVGIHIQAKSNLNELERAADKLRQFGGVSESASRKIDLLVESLQNSAQTDVNRLTGQIDKLKEKVNDPNLGKGERKQTQEEINGLKSKIAELKKLQKIKADDYGMMEQDARHALEKLRNKKKLTDAEKEHLKVVEQLLKYTDKYNRAKVGLNEIHFNKIQKQWDEKREQAESRGMDVNKTIGKYVKRGAGLMIGGSLLGFGVNAMKKWAELDTIVTHLSASLDDLSKIEIEAMNNMANDLGHTNEEAMKLQKTLASISGDMNNLERAGFENLLDYGRDTGIGPLALQLRQVQRYSGESMKPGNDKELLKEMTSVAKALTMRGGRMEEFINTSIAMVKNMERANMRVSADDLLRNTLAPAAVFGGEDRGRGQRGLSFMERLNEGLTASHDMMNLSMLRTIGQPKSFQEMWDFKKLREQGVWAESPKSGNPMFMDVIDTFKNMYGGKHRAMAMMKSAMPNMSAIEIEQMFKMNEGLNAGTWNMRMGALKDKDKKKLSKAGFEMGEFTNDAGEKVFGLLNMSVEEFNKLSKEFPKLVQEIRGKDKVSAGEKWKVAIEDMQKSIGGIFGNTTISLLTNIALAVDSVADKITPSYKSKRKEILSLRNMNEQMNIKPEVEKLKKDLLEKERAYKKALKTEDEGIIGAARNKRNDAQKKLDKKKQQMNDLEYEYQILTDKDFAEDEKMDNWVSSIVAQKKGEKSGVAPEVAKRIYKQKFIDEGYGFFERKKLIDDAEKKAIKKADDIINKQNKQSGDIKNRSVNIQPRGSGMTGLQEDETWKQKYNQEKAKEVLEKNATTRSEIDRMETAGKPIDPAAIDAGRGGSGGGGGRPEKPPEPGETQSNNYYTIYIEREKFPDVITDPKKALGATIPFLRTDNEDY